MVCFFAALAELSALLPNFFGVCEHQRGACRIYVFNASDRQLVIVRNNLPCAVGGLRRSSANVRIVRSNLPMSAINLRAIELARDFVSTVE